DIERITWPSTVALDFRGFGGWPQHGRGRVTWGGVEGSIGVFTIACLQGFADASRVDGTGFAGRSAAGVAALVHRTVVCHVHAAGGRGGRADGAAHGVWDAAGRRAADGGVASPPAPVLLGQPVVGRRAGTGAGPAGRGAGAARRGGAPGRGGG